MLSLPPHRPPRPQLKDNTKMSMLRNATWTLSNFCRGKPQPDFEQVGRWRGGAGWGGRTRDEAGLGVVARQARVG